MTALPNASPFLTLHELVKKARQKLNQDDWDYIVGATETETTLRRNRLALDSLAEFSGPAFAAAASDGTRWQPGTVLTRCCGQFGQSL